MRRMFTLATVAALSVAVSVSAAEPTQGRGNANNKNAEWVVSAIFDPVAGSPELTFAFCALIPPGLAQGRLGNAYNNAQGDEGIDNALNTSQCLVLTVDPEFNEPPFPIILDDWPDECVDAIQWDADPLPHEESCPPLP